MFGEPFPEKVDALCDYVTERDKHQRCAGNSENCANAAAGKPGRDMQKEAEPAEHQHREDAGDNGAFTIFHRYASTVTSVLGFAWQARMMPFRMSSSSCTHRRCRSGRRNRCRYRVLPTIRESSDPREFSRICCSSKMRPAD